MVHGTSVRVASARSKPPTDLRCRNTHDAYHIVEQEELVCSAVVYPGDTQEVQAIVRWANKHRIPIYPISMGRNIGYGGAAPRVPGSVVVDLGRRMSKVLKIDGGSASCMVEPGVSYFKLYDEIQKTGLPLWIDTPDLGGGSVMGNALDRGVGYVLFRLFRITTCQSSLYPALAPYNSNT